MLIPYLQVPSIPSIKKDRFFFTRQYFAGKKGHWLNHFKTQPERHWADWAVSFQAEIGIAPEQLWCRGFCWPPRQPPQISAVQNWWVLKKIIRSGKISRKFWGWLLKGQLDNFLSVESSKIKTWRETAGNKWLILLGAKVPSKLNNFQRIGTLWEGHHFTRSTSSAGSVGATILGTLMASCIILCKYINLVVAESILCAFPSLSLKELSDLWKSQYGL